MGGKSSQPTIGYWYRYLIHLGLGQAIDALLEFRGGERAAWAGRAEGGTVAINARELWGGEKAEGGIEGELDVMLGLADQDPNPRLTALLGDQQSAYRNRSSVAFEGLYGAFNPYPKAPSFKVERIYKGWQDDVVWYPEKAQVGEGYTPDAGGDPLSVVEVIRFTAETAHEQTPYLHLREDGSLGFLYGFNSGLNLGDTYVTGTMDPATLSVTSNTTHTVTDMNGTTSLGLRGTDDSGNVLASGQSSGECAVMQDGVVIGTYTPAGEDTSWWYAEQFQAPEFGGLVWFDKGGGADLYLGVRDTGGGFDHVIRTLYKFDYPTLSLNAVESVKVENIGHSASPYFWMSRDNAGSVWILGTDGVLTQYSSSLVVLSTSAGWPVESPDEDSSPVRGFGVEGELIAFLYVDNTCKMFNRITKAEIATVEVPFVDLSLYTNGLQNTRVMFSAGKIFIQASHWLAKLSYSAPPMSSTSGYMNPAHILYDSLTHANMEGLPADLIDEASFVAAADLFYAEGFGLCARFNPVSETVEAFQKRICNVVGASLVRSRIDGKYYLTPVRGVHDLGSLPILEDDDILEYEEEPSDPLESVNQVSVEWFDPQRKKKRTTAPLQSLGAIQSVGGIIAEVASYPEIPYEELALRVGARDLAQKATPLKRFRLTTNRVPYAWRAGQYFRLQAPRRGIADMVCLVGEIDAGTPRSGSMRLVAIQDVSTMPLTVYVVPEPGVDTSPSQDPTVPPAQKLIEAPYVELVGALAPADLGSMAADAGYLLALATRPESGLNFALYTAAAGETLADRGAGDWCPSALVVEAATRDPAQVDFTIEDGSDLNLVTVGTAALWGEEIVRVDAIDTTALTVTLGRGCADTTPQEHAAGERIWFYDNWATSDQREYAAGETVEAKVLTRTESKMLDPVLAPTLSLELETRAARPYPPGRLRITDAFIADVAYPSSAAGALTVSWAHRDRLLQADQLVDESDGNIGPEPGVTYTVRCYVDNVLDQTFEGISGTSQAVTPSANGLVRIEVEAVRGSIAVEGDLNGGFEDATPAWTPDPANAGGGTFSIVMDPAIARTGDYGLKYEGVPGPDGAWTVEDIVCGENLYPTSDIGAPINFGFWADVTDISTGSQMLVAVRPILQMRAISDDSLLGEYAPGGEDTVLRGWGKLGEGWQLSGRRITYGHVNGFQVYFRPLIRVSSIPQGTPPAAFTVRVDDFYAAFEGSAPAETGVLTSWQVATAEFNWLGISARATDSDDIRITDSGDTRASEG